MAKSSIYKKAVGLRYQAGKTDAPELSVKGQQHVADEIVKVARRYGVPVVEDATMAKALHAFEIDEVIPEKLYEAVAILLANLDSPSNRSPNSNVPNVPKI
jgi:flagellar biosynthesis protein